jgi:hypothetical protein
MVIRQGNLAFRKGKDRHVASREQKVEEESCVSASDDRLLTNDNSEKI